MLGTDYAKHSDFCAVKLQSLSTFQALRQSLRMVLDAAPRELCHLVLLNLVMGVGPSVSLFLGKVAIDEVARLLLQGTTTTALGLIWSKPTLLWSLVGIIGLSLMVDSVGAIDTTLFAALRDRVRGFLQSKVLHKVATFEDIALFETPALLNLLELTEKGMQRIQQLSFIMAASLMGLFMFLPSVALSLSIKWWVPLVLLASSVPSIVVEMRHHKRSWRVEETQASLSREMDLYSQMLMDEAYAKELRLFSLQPILLGRWKRLFQQMFSTMQQVRQQGALGVVLWAVVGGLGAALPYVYVVEGVLRGTYTIGDLALYTGIILQLRRSLYILIGHMGDLYDVALATSPIFQLLALEPQLQSGNRSLTPPASRASFSSWEDENQAQDVMARQSAGIQLQQVSFSYPGSEQQTLSAIDLTIHAGEMVALVGENGAGKTTLAKLLCRLYDPTEGTIHWHGVDLRNVDLEHLRSRIAVVMQDYARFPATLRENVGWGYMPKLHEDLAIQTALQDAGIDRLLTELSQGLETPLGKQLEDGVDLSGGQWQRIAIARALLRLSQVELLVFDEPTAALDPKNEQDIYRIFRTIAQGRMTVVVSHRLALAKLADRIIVLEHGKIVEAGSHDQLMQQGKHYYTMFTRQASSYH